ncbi:MAG TPA: EAL domain-containing protein [Pyrinomonadaceae bacterium]|nr:EAL domain-containing protein [Pyrinomonadaceae bacterium]
MVALVMAWSPVRRVNAGRFEVKHPGDYATFNSNHSRDATDIEDALRQSCLPARVLEIEITENVALNCEEAIVRLRKLHKKGVKITFDDFGTGYASLSNLTRFPLSRIKIDQSFVFNLAESAESDAIVRSLIAMAHNLGLEVIAEGVETDTQEAFLINEGCEVAQGYLYAHPLPAGEFEAYLRTKQIREWNPGAKKVAHG